MSSVSMLTKIKVLLNVTAEATPQPKDMSSGLTYQAETFQPMLFVPRLKISIR
jgi:hypothetical protein